MELERLQARREVAFEVPRLAAPEGRACNSAVPSLELRRCGDALGRELREAGAEVLGGLGEPELRKRPDGPGVIDVTAKHLDASRPGD
eukprot:5210364-Alexandrium_andersonii.AAC.1